jgi:hypothetical protein
MITGTTRSLCFEIFSLVVLQWRTEGGLGDSNPLPPKYKSFDKAEPNSQVLGKYIHNNLIRTKVSLICKFSGTPE